MALGKITAATFGVGGYDDAMIGLSLTFEADRGAVSQFRGTWATWSERCQWTEADQTQSWGDTVRFLAKILKESRRKSVSDLVGVPVELTFDGNSLADWRVLTEVL
jgi:hypothetical protein